MSVDSSRRWRGLLRALRRNTATASEGAVRVDAPGLRREAAVLRASQHIDQTPERPDDARPAANAQRVRARVLRAARHRHRAQVRPHRNPWAGDGLHHDEEGQGICQEIHGVIMSSDYQKRYQKRRRAELHANGQCVSCGGPKLDASKKICEQCRAYARARQKFDRDDRKLSDEDIRYLLQRYAHIVGDF